MYHNYVKMGCIKRPLKMMMYNRGERRVRWAVANRIRPAAINDRGKNNNKYLQRKIEIIISDMKKLYGHVPTYEWDYCHNSLNISYDVVRTSLTIELVCLMPWLLIRLYTPELSLKQIIYLMVHPEALRPVNTESLGIIFIYIHGIAILSIIISQIHSVINVISNIMPHFSFLRFASKGQCPKTPLSKSSLGIRSNFFCQGLVITKSGLYKISNFEFSIWPVKHGNSYNIFT